MPFWLRVNMFLRSLFLQAGWNYAKYQNLGCLFVMTPFLRQLYAKDPEALPTVMNRYLEAFNTHPVMASFCFGAMARQEQDIAYSSTVSAGEENVLIWTSTRKAISITAASIGDRLFWGTLKPLTLLLAIACWMMLDVPFFQLQPQSGAIPFIYGFSGAIMSFFVYNSIAWFVRWQGLKLSYQSDDSSCFGLTRFDWNRTIYNAKRLGVFLSAALIVFAVYRYFSRTEINVHFWAQATLVMCFILMAFLTRRLRIPNIYLYITTVVVLAAVCVF